MKHFTMFTDCCTETSFRASSTLKAFAISLVFVLCGWSASNAQSINCPDGVEVPCTEVFAIAASNPATVSSNPYNQPFNVTYSDVDVVGTGCSRVITRTWVVSFAAVPGHPATTRTCNQIISTVDNQNPVIGGVTPVINVQCADDVPGFANASVDACTGNETLTMFASHTGRADSICNVTTAIGPGMDWALWLPDLASPNSSLSNDEYVLSASWVFDANGGKFEQYVDGTARLFGRIINSSNPSHAFTVDFWFKNRADWGGAYGWQAQGRYYKDDLGLAGQNYINWDYYEMVNGMSTLTGDGSLEGAILHMNHMPANYYFGFQVGVGANNKNSHKGISGWFTYNGRINDECVTGHGDVNADLSCEPAPALCPNDDNFTYIYYAANYCCRATVLKQHIIVDDTIAPLFDNNNFPADVTQECSAPVAAVATGLTATDNCSAPSAITINFVGETTQYLDQNGQPCLPVDACTTIITRTWEAIDECGNRAERSQVITRIDTTNPTFNTYNHYISVECDQADQIFVTADDNCDTDVEITYTEILQSGGCMGVLARTYTAKDNCGNSVETVQYIALLDTTDPTFINVPANDTIQCNEVNPNGYGAAGVAGVDNCGLDVTITYSEVIEPTNDNCPNSYNIKRTWTGTDYCENVATIVRYIYVIDTTNPVYTSFPADINISCTDPIPAVVYPTATDNCDNQVTITLAVSQVPGACPQSYDILRVFRGEDNCGNQVVQTQTIRVRDTGGVVLGNTPATPITVECNAVPNPANVTVSDNCDPNPTVTYTQVRTDGSCTDTYTLTRTWVGRDACNNTATFVQTINVRDTTQPVLSGTPSANITVECNAVPAPANVTATDNCDTSVSLTYNQTRINGNCNYNYTLVRTWTATDNCSNVRTFVQNITVRDTQAPIISGDFSITRLCSDIDGIYVTATDNCGSISWDYEDTHVSGGCAGTVIRRYYATDECGNVSDMFEQTIHLFDNIAPVAVSTPDFTIDCDDETPIVPEPVWSDNCDDMLMVAYSYSEEQVDSTDDCPDYDRIYTWTATDHCGNSTVAVTRVHVVDRTAPVFVTFPQDVTVTCGGTIPPVSYPIIDDNCDDYPDLEMIEDTVGSGCYHTFTIERRFKIWDVCGNERRDTQFVYVVNNLVQPVIVGSLQIDRPCNDFGGIYVSVQNAACNIVTWEFWDEEVSGACGGNIIRHYYATNACGVESAEFIQIIHLIDNQLPSVAVQPTNVTSQCGNDIPSYTPVWSDNCDTELETTYNITPYDATQCAYSYTQTWTATDNCGNTRTISRTVNVNDNIAPVFANIPVVASYECTNAGNIVIGMPTATDNCTPANQITITVSLDTIPGLCPAEYQIVRTWTATDRCNNSRSVSRAITVTDNGGIAFGEYDSHYEFNCGDDYSTPVPPVTDSCSEIVSVVATTVETDPCTGSFNRIWTATDACGNTATATVYITVVDNVDPYFTNCPDDVVLPCDVYTLPAPTAPNAEDACDDNVQVGYTQHLFGDVPPAGAEPDGYCVMETPVRPVGNPCGYPVDWGLALHTMPVQYRYYTIEDGRWTRYADRVEVSMHVKVAALPGSPALNAGWDVEMTFDEGSSAIEWFNGVHGFKADCGGLDSPGNWEFFILESGATMTGWGAFAGSALSLEHAPVNQYFGYQLGTGANNYNADEDGFGGWFGYSGTFRANPNAQLQNVFGAGDVCCTLNCCPRYYAVRQWTAIDCSDNSTVCIQNISWSGVVVNNTTNSGSAMEFGAGMEAGRLTSTITAQPNPANNNTLFTFRAANTAKTSVEIYDLTGKKVADVFVGSVEAGNEYRVDFNVSNLATGVYTYRLTNGSEVKIERLIISK